MTQGGTKTKLHLGCGEEYLEGYINIDYPPSEHTVMSAKADVYTDIRTLRYPENSVDEIRSHHLFEHFNRAEALHMLLAWREWLKPGGKLIIETPDFGLSARAYTFTLSQKRRMQLGRHMLGSQEAPWANHYDFWDKRKFADVLHALGFVHVRCRRYTNRIAQHYPNVPLLNFFGKFLPDVIYRRYGGHRLPNIVAVAEKDASARIDEEKAARRILSSYLVGNEKEILSVWMKDFQKLRQAYRDGR